LLIGVKQVRLSIRSSSFVGLVRDAVGKRVTAPKGDENSIDEDRTMKTREVFN
jgi:hypothetical protein